MYAARLPTRTYIHTCNCSFTKKVSHSTTDLTPINLNYPCRACQYGQCFTAQARINAKYLDQLVNTRTSARIVSGLQFRSSSADSTSTSGSQRNRETEMLAAQIKIMDAWQKEEEQIWRSFKGLYNLPQNVFHMESFLQWDDPQILPQAEPDARHSTALVEAFDEGTIGLTASPVEESPESEGERRRKWEESERKVGRWDGLRSSVERERWPPSPLS